jgi:hypothetical protein
MADQSNTAATDRELLGLAAKAAGIEVTAVVADGIPHRFGGGYWNPLTDDGDALRLAAKLILAITEREDTPIERPHGYGATVYARPYIRKMGRFPGLAESLELGAAEEYLPEGCEPCGEWDKRPSRLIATRRAIVRAAAEIGRNHG